jgi:hypothetical protein
VRSIYSSVKQVSDTLFSESGNAFRTAVLVQWPREGVWTVAFITGSPSGEVAAYLRDEYVSVYVPTTPNPTGPASRSSLCGSTCASRTSRTGRRLATAKQPAKQTTACPACRRPRKQTAQHGDAGQHLGQGVKKSPATLTATGWLVFQVFQVLVGLRAGFAGVCAGFVGGLLHGAQASQDALQQPLLRLTAGVFVFAAKLSPRLPAARNRGGHFFHGLDSGVNLIRARCCLLRHGLGCIGHAVCC